MGLHLKLAQYAFLTLVMIGLSACGGAPSSGGVSGSGGSTVQFVSASESQLVLKGQGGVETSVLTFSVTSVDGTAISDQAVEFELSTDVGGVRLLAASGETNTTGQVSVALESGTVAVAVSVAATISGTDTRAVSDEIQLSTSSFIASRFPLTAILSDSVTPGTNGVDVAEAGMLQGVQVTLQMILTDQFGHKVLDGSRVTFVSPETGLIEPGTCELAAGVCQATWTSTESGLVGEQVSILAYASGAEEFTDQNANNIYELGEPFVDLGEAYLDENENGSYDLGEFYLDENANQIYDPLGNGVWDGPCLTSQDECVGDPSTIISDSIILCLDC